MTISPDTILQIIATIVISLAGLFLKRLYTQFQVIFEKLEQIDLRQDNITERLIKLEVEYNHCCKAKATNGKIEVLGDRLKSN